MVGFRVLGFFFKDIFRWVVTVINSPPVISFKFWVVRGFKALKLLSRSRGSGRAPFRDLQGSGLFKAWGSFTESFKASKSKV